jgi:hypothetical protein
MTLGDDSQSDLGDVRTVARPFDHWDGADYAGMPAVELRTSQETFGVAHVPLYRARPISLDQCSSPALLSLDTI